MGSLSSSPVCTFCGGVPHEIRHCPACWDADTTRAALLMQLKINRHACLDWAEDHSYLQRLCREVGYTEREVEGDSYGVPCIMDLADMLRTKIPALVPLPDDPQ